MESRAQQLLEKYASFSPADAVELASIVQEATEALKTVRGAFVASSGVPTTMNPAWEAAHAALNKIESR